MNVDLRGHGRSGRPQIPFTLPVLLQDLEMVLAQNRVDEAVLVGHSLGGRLVLALAAKRPQLAAGVVLLDTAVVEEADYVAQRRRELDAPDWDAHLRQRVERLFRGSSLSPASRHAAAVMLSTPHEIATWSLDAADAVDAPAALAGLAVPALYIAASTPREERSTLVDLQPRLVFGQTIYSGHFVQLDAGKQVGAMLSCFCDTNWDAAR